MCSLAIINMLPITNQQSYDMANQVQLIPLQYIILCCHLLGHLHDWQSKAGEKMISLLIATSEA